MQNVEWKHLLSTKPKLRTYVKFKKKIFVLKIMLNTALLEEKGH